MRMRFKPYARPELLACDFHVHEPLTHAGHWHELYARPEQPLHLELGCGKGGFLRKNAEAYPDVNFIGIERQETVVAMAADRKSTRLNSSHNVIARMPSSA